MKKNLLILLLSILFLPIKAQVGINTNTPSVSAALQLESQGTKGLLYPTMTTAQRLAITNPAEGLVVYDSELSVLTYFNNKDNSGNNIESNWVKLSGSSYTSTSTPPKALNSKIDLTNIDVGTLLTMSYQYYDEESNLELGTQIEWYRADNYALNSNVTKIVGATSTTYTTTIADKGKFIFAAILPKNNIGEVGGLVLTAPIYVKTVISMVHPSNGITYNYGTIFSKETGKIWLDRNIGATQIATSIYDQNAIGFYYQWGRNSDGHELPGSTVYSGVATTPNSTGQPWEGKFINPNGFTSNLNWYNVNDSTLWNSTNGGINNPCPTGFRVPSYTEWIEEIKYLTEPGIVGAFQKFKLVNAMLKNYTGISNQSNSVRYATNTTTVSTTNFNHRYPVLTPIATRAGSTNTSSALPVRCVNIN